MLNNRDLNIDQNNHDYDFCHNRAALVSTLGRALTMALSLHEGKAEAHWEKGPTWSSM